MGGIGDNEWIHLQNIERFRAGLAAARDEPQRKILTELLAQEEMKLNRLRSTYPGSSGDR